MDLQFVVFTAGPFRYQQIGAEARTMRKLGMSFRAIGRALGVDEKTVRKAHAKREVRLLDASAPEGYDEDE